MGKNIPRYKKTLKKVHVYREETRGTFGEHKGIRLWGHL